MRCFDSLRLHNQVRSSRGSYTFHNQDFREQESYSENTNLTFSFVRTKCLNVVK